MERYKTVLQGRDVEAIDILLKVHCAVDNPKILDVTYNTGKMWKGASYQPTRMDIDSSLELDIVGDFTSIPFQEATYDVIVFDPPHLPTHAASENSSKIWEKRYGITSSGEGREGDNVSGMFLPFLKEAKRVLKSGGIVLAKIADIVHNHRYQWHCVDFINAVREVGMTPCDMLIKCDPNAGNLQSSKWNNVKHLRKAHCYWIVVRNSNKCEVKKVIL
jgi:hypothetical protein